MALALAACDAGTIEDSPGGADAGAPGDVDAGGPVADADPLAPDAAPVDPCEPIEGASYELLSTDGPITDRPAAEHADLNIELRGWSATAAALGLVDVGGPTDALAPQLATLFAPDRLPGFAAVDRVNNWDWGTNSVAGPITDWEVTLAELATTPGEVIETPDSGYDIGGGHEARVLYADADSIFIKYTRDDNVVIGYGVHVTGLCVEPSLLSLYEAANAAGRGELPAVRANQPLGRARSTAIGVAVRDSGAFMDPRVRKDWWVGW